MPDPLTSQISQLHARADADSIERAAELEREAEKSGRSPRQPRPSGGVFIGAEAEAALQREAATGDGEVV